MNRGRGQYRHSRGGRGWGRVSQARRPDPFPDPPKGALIAKIRREDLASLQGSGVPKYVGIGDVELVASFNWMEGAAPEIMVPGKPPRWTPPAQQPRLEEDDPNGTYYRDYNAASYPRHPTEPAIACALTMRPSGGPRDLELFACGSTLGNLLRFTEGSERPFRILVNVVGNVVHLLRREKSPMEELVGIRGFGHTFPEANTTWDPDVRGSVSHQRILRYRLGGINTLIRFEADGYLPMPANTADSNKTERTSKLGVSDNSSASNGIDIQLGGLSVTSRCKKPTGAKHRELVIRNGGEAIPQDRVFDLKTRSHKRKGDDILGEELPRLWLRQMEHFVLGFHQQHVFRDVTVHDIKDRIAEWERSHQQLVASLAGLLRDIMGRARERPDGRFEVIYAGQGPLEIHEQLPDAGNMLSDKRLGEWKLWLNRGGDSPRDDAPRSSAARDDADSDSDFEDFTMCSKECNYCGKCPF